MGDSTIVSFMPMDLRVPLASMIPAAVWIYGIKEESPLDDFAVSYVPDCTSFVYILDKKSVRTSIRSEEVAGAIVYDYIKASLYIGDEAFPGLKSIPGMHTKDEIKKMFAKELAELLKCHKNWLANLVNAADDIWKDPTARGQSRSISDMQRFAARRLGLNKDWMNPASTTQTKCPACTSFISEDALVCPVCTTVIKPKEFAAFQQVAVAATK